MTDELAKTPPLPLRIARPVLSALAKPHRWLYARYGGRLVNRKEDSAVLMLTSIGRKSGQGRSVLLNHVKDGADLIVVGSNWGYERPPAWLLNLQANPQAKVTVAGAEQDVFAQFPEGSEEARCWTVYTDAMPQMIQVAEGTNRALPVVKLVPN